VIEHEVRQRLCLEIPDARHARAARRSVAVLDGDRDDRLARSAAPVLAGPRSTDVPLIDLDRAAEQLAAGQHHRASQLVQPLPGGLVAAQAQHARQPQGADAALVDDVPDCRKPALQRQPAGMKDRPRRHRALVRTGRTLAIARWRASLPKTMRHGAHRALRQVLSAAVRWRWIEHNVATDIKNPVHAREEFTPFESWEEVDALARELGPFGPLTILSVGTGVRPEEAFGADWNDVDLATGVFTVRRAFAKGRLKAYPKTVRSRRRVPLRAKVLDALGELPDRDGVLFPASEGGRINIDNFRAREWAPALKAAGIAHRRIYDMRHTFATWSLAAGMSIFTLARRMGTSVQMIDVTYGHFAHARRIRTVVC
jgi:integrase